MSRSPQASDGVARIKLLYGKSNKSLLKCLTELDPQLSLSLLTFSNGWMKKGIHLYYANLRNILLLKMIFKKFEI